LVRQHVSYLVYTATIHSAEASLGHVGTYTQRNDSAQERDPDHRVARQLLGEDERGAEPVAEDDLHYDGQRHHADPDEGQRLEDPRHAADQRAHGYLFSAIPMSTSSLPFGPRSASAWS